MAAAIYTLVSLVLYLAASNKNPGSDGHYSWLFARSLAYDGDLDFTNDYALCGDPFKVGIETAAHRPANFFYLGPAVFWTPVVWILKHFAPAEWANGCVGTVPNVTLAMSSFAGGVTVLATSAVARRFFDARLAAFVALLVGLGGHLVYFTGMMPSYSHAYDAMCVAVFLYFTVRMREAPGRRLLWVLAGAFLGLAILQRAIDAIFLVVPLAALGRRALRPAAVVGTLAFVTGIVPLLVATHAITGCWTVYAHGPHFLHYAHAHPILLVFDQRGGVFVWAPVLWLAVPGAFLLLVRRDVRWLAVSLMACAAVELFVSSAALDWQGARRLVNLTPLGALAVAAFLDPCVRWLLARRERIVYAAAAFAIGLAAWTQGSVSVGYRRNRIPWDQPVGLGGRYGEGQAAVLDETESIVGPLTAAPASWIFAMRYGLRPSAYGWATHPGWYERNAQTLDFDAAGLSLTSREARMLLRGLRVDDEHDTGACFADTKGAIVLSLQWPIATRARLTYDAVSSATLSVGSRTFFGQRTPWERVPIAAGRSRDVIMHIPEGGVDSGVNEIELAVSERAAKVCLRGLEFVDDTRYEASPFSLASFPVTIWHARSPTATRAALLARIPRRSPENRFGNIVVGVEAHGDDLFMKVGEMDARGEITWQKPRKYDSGRNPEIAIDPVTGHGIEVHDGDGGAWSHELDVLATTAAPRK